jgi:methylenetetrahydrofolate--tRNA-(uracil-5-)-methyltransferase
MGALVAHVTGGHIAAGGGSFQPMNVNYGLFPDIAEFETTDESGKRLKGADRTRSKKKAMSLRALADLDGWLAWQAARVEAAVG